MTYIVLLWFLFRLLVFDTRSHSVTQAGLTLVAMILLPGITLVCELLHSTYLEWVFFLPQVFQTNRPQGSALLRMSQDHKSESLCSRNDKRHLKLP